MGAVGPRPTVHALRPNYPNPFNPSTRIRYRVGLREHVHRATVDGGSGFGVTNSLPIELGLGAARQVDHLRIDWPSGQTDHFYDVEANQVLRVVEGRAQD